MYQLPFHLDAGGRSGDEVRALAGISVLCFLQRFDTDGWLAVCVPCYGRPME